MQSRYKRTAIALKAIIALCAALCTSLAGCGLAYADHVPSPAPLQLPEIRVSSPRDTGTISLTQPGIGQAQRAINKTAGGVSIVDLEAVREGRVANFTDTLGMAAGVFVQSRFGADESRLSIRGSGLQRTFHGRGIRLMQDGIPVNLADGSFDFQAIEPLATRYIEVFRGANALRYGASNLGGAVNFVSPTGHDTPPVELRTEAGSFGYGRAGFTTGGLSGDHIDYFASGSWLRLDGFRDHSEQHAERFTGNVGIRVAEHIETRFYAGYTHSDSGLPGNLTQAQLRRDPRQSQLHANPDNPFVQRLGQQKRDLELRRIANKTSIVLDDTTVQLSVFYVNKHLFHPIFQVLDVTSEDYGLEARVSHSGELWGHRTEWVAGYMPTYGQADDNRFINIGGRPVTRTNRLRQTASNHEFYLENRWFATEKLAIIGGLQYARSQRKTNDRFFATAEEDESFSKTYSRVSPKFGLLYEPAPRVQWFANLSRSFEPPSFGELAGGLRPNIVQAQTGTTLELGTRGNSHQLDWDIALYHAGLRNELLQTQLFAAGNNPIASPQTSNADKTIHSGLEMAFTARLPLNLELRQNLLINEFRFDDDPVFGNRRLPGIPRTLLRAELLYRMAGFYIGPTLESSPQRYAVDFAEKLHAKRYTIYGLKLGQQLNEQLSWFVEGRNLADRKYAATTGVALQANANSALFLPGDGRSVYAGVQWRY